MTTHGFHCTPIMKAACIATAGAGLLLPPDIRAALALDVPRVLGGGELWRLLTRHLAFESLGDTCVGLILLYRFRQFERLLGSGKFGAFALVTGTLATSLEAAGALLLSGGAPGFTPAAGPYSLVFACATLYHAWVPRTHPKLVGVFGIDFSEKSLT